MQSEFFGENFSDRSTLTNQTFAAAVISASYVAEIDPETGADAHQVKNANAYETRINRESAILQDNAVQVRGEEKSPAETLTTACQAASWLA